MPAGHCVTVAMGAVSDAIRCFYGIRWCRIQEISEPLKRTPVSFVCRSQAFRSAVCVFPDKSGQVRGLPQRTLLPVTGRGVAV